MLSPPIMATGLGIIGSGESETSTQPRVLSPHKTHKSPTNARAAKNTIAKSSATYIKHTVIAVTSERGTRGRPDADIMGWPP